MTMNKQESNVREEFAPTPRIWRLIWWASLMSIGLAFLALALFDISLVERLLSFAVGIILSAVAWRMVRLNIDCASLCLEGEVLIVTRKNAEPILFNLSSDIISVDRFDARAGNEMIVELRANGKSFRLVTSFYQNTDRLKDYLQNRLGIVDEK